MNIKYFQALGLLTFLILTLFSFGLATSSSYAQEADLAEATFYVY